LRRPVFGRADRSSGALSERLPIGVADAEALGGLVDGPGRREAPSLGHYFLRRRRARRLSPQYSSASRFTAGAAGFLIFSQPFHREPKSIAVAHRSHGMELLIYCCCGGRVAAETAKTLSSSSAVSTGLAVTARSLRHWQILEGLQHQSRLSNQQWPALCSRPVQNTKTRVCIRPPPRTLQRQPSGQ
jgi:hypothetical protein